jgi:NAD-dependent SIR2 family protein deacetylase
MGYTKIETPADTEYCEDCEQDFPRAEMSEKYYRMEILWCNECRDSYDPTPQEQWEVTSPTDLSVVMNEHGRVF